MKKKKVVAVLSAMIMSASIILTAGISGKAEEGNTRKLEFVLENGGEELPAIVDEDLQVIQEAFGADWLNTSRGRTFSKGSTVSIDWGQSSLQREAVYASEVQAYWFDRDASGNLVLETDCPISWAYYEVDSDGNIDRSHWGRGRDDWNAYLETAVDEDTSPNYTGATFWNCDLLDYYPRLPDLVVFWVGYDPKLGEDGFIETASWCIEYYVVEKDEYVFNFKDEDTDATTTEESQDPTTEDSQDTPTTEDSQDTPTTEDSQDTPTTETNTQPTTEGSNVTDDNVTTQDNETTETNATTEENINNTESSSPKTGDTAMLLPCFILFVSAFGMAVVLKKYRKM